MVSVHDAHRRLDNLRQIIALLVGQLEGCSHPLADCSGKAHESIIFLPLVGVQEHLWLTA
jgi:hypothetical protein